MIIFNVPKEDLKKIRDVFIRKIGFFIFFIFVLFLDSNYFSKNVTNSQILINILMLVGFFLLYFKSKPRVKELMLYAVLIGIGGEYLFSRVLDMYTYRLENVPLYVPIGHAALYARVFKFSSAPIVRKHHKAVEQLFLIIIVSFATIYLFFFTDVFQTLKIVK